MPKKKRRRRVPVVVANKLYIPKQYVTQDDLERWTYYWTDTVFEDVVDKYGRVVRKRNGQPEQEAHEIDRVLRTYAYLSTGTGKLRYYSFPRGNLRKIRSYTTAPFKSVDLRVAPPLDFHLKMNPSTMKDKRWKDQSRCVRSWMRKGYGVIKGDPGSGKTVMGIGVMYQLGVKTLIISKRKDAFKHWDKEIRFHTDIDDHEELTGRQLLGEFVGSRKKGNDYPIMVITVQSLIKDYGHQRLLNIHDQYGLLLIDEAHELCTPEFSKPLTAFNPAFLLGVTATPERTDRGHYFLYDVIGPIVAEGKAKQMPPTATFIHTGVSAPSWIYDGRFPRHFQWIKVLGHLENHSERTKLIFKNAVKDIKNKRVVVCYSERRKIIKKLHELFKKNDISSAYVDGGTKNREKYYEGLRTGEYQVLCAGKVLNALVNIPEIDCMHVCTPVNGKTAVLQIYGRSRRPKKGKRNPVIRDYVDIGGQLDGAYRNRVKICQEQDWTIEVVGSTLTDKASKTMKYVKRK